MKSISYPYKMKYGLSIGCMILCGFATVLFTKMAFENESGLIINHLIYLSVTSASIFYWCLSAASMLFTLPLLYSLNKGFLENKVVHLDQKGITAPKSGISSRKISIPYKEVFAVMVEENTGGKFLKIIAPHQQLVIPCCMLAKNDFDNLVNELEARVEAEKIE